MREERSVSQILFSYLPDQTVDLRREIWQVREWANPEPSQVDDGTLRTALLRAAYPWSRRSADAGYAERIRSGYDVRVLTLNTEAGVRVRHFPDVWTCRSCKRVVDGKQCVCGSRDKTQVPFVGYHECGAVTEPFVPRCNEHGQVRLTYPGTASARDIRFTCPVCQRVLQKGLGTRRCSCGGGVYKFTVHRAASVYRPCPVVVVNPPSAKEVQELRAAGGSERALHWVLDGMTTRSMEEQEHSRSEFVAGLVAQGIPQHLAEQWADQAVERGHVEDGGGDLDLDFAEDTYREASDEAVTMATATARSRILVRDVCDGEDRGRAYADRYSQGLDASGLEAVELITQLPILTGQFGYVRGTEETQLVPFRDRAGRLAVYADVGETEGLLVRLDPTNVVKWLVSRGHPLTSSDDARSARIEVLKHARVPYPGSEGTETPLGNDLVTLIHSYAHRFVRRVALYAGIEVTALGELLLPHHLAFVVYATPRGDFVLGGLQAVFETELPALLVDVAGGEHRCSLDPGCAKAGGACMACLHLGEPSCRRYNLDLDRRVLHGPTGYLTAAASEAST